LRRKKISAIGHRGRVGQHKLGRIDQETTADIDPSESGMATNIIPNLVVLKGEPVPIAKKLGLDPAMKKWKTRRQI
jgi:hypothetical protein